MSVRTGSGRVTRQAARSMRVATRARVVPAIARRLAGRRNRASAAVWQKRPSAVEAMRAIAKWHAACTSPSGHSAPGGGRHTTSPSSEADRLAVSRSSGGSR